MTPSSFRSPHPSGLNIPSYRRKNYAAPAFHSADAHIQHPPFTTARGWDPLAPRSVTPATAHATPARTSWQTLARQRAAAKRVAQPTPLVPPNITAPATHHTRHQPILSLPAAGRHPATAPAPQPLGPVRQRRRHSPQPAAMPLLSAYQRLASLCQRLVPLSALPA